jgi:hypothetical protein
MKKASFVVIMAGACFFLSRACVGPTNIEGVAFTSGETIHLQTLMNMGVENVNYLKEADTFNVGVRYKSHYDARATVFIGTYGMSFHQNVSMNCMGVVFPLPESASAYASIDKATFNFASAVKTELAWLASKGIVEITAEMTGKIDSTLLVSRNGGVQYWTHANSALEYNTWYTSDSISGVWSRDGVYGVKSVNGVNGCSVVKPGSGAPSAGLGTTAIVRSLNAVSHRMQVLSVRRLGDGGLIAFLPQRRASEAFVVVTDCKGAVVQTKRVSAGVQSLYISGLAFGRYAVRLMK